MKLSRIVCQCVRVESDVRVLCVRVGSVKLKDVRVSRGGRGVLWGGGQVERRGCVMCHACTGSGGRTWGCHVVCVLGQIEKLGGWGGGDPVFVSVERCSVVTYCVSSQVERRADVMCCLYWVRWKDVGMRARLAWIQRSVLPVGAPGQDLVADGASQMRSEWQYAGFHPQ